MADVCCQICGKPNPKELEECQYCGAHIKPDEPSTPGAYQAIPDPGSSSGLPDWLSGLDEAGSEDEEIPDWLAGLRGGKAIESTPAPVEEEESAPEPVNEDWMTRLGGEPQQAIPESPNIVKPPALETPALEASPEPTSESNLPDWLQNLQSPESGVHEPSTASPGGAYIPGLSDLPGVFAENSSTLNGGGEPAPAESTPDWLSGFRSVPAVPDSTPGENVPEWLSDLEAKSGPESGTPAASSGNEPSAESNSTTGTSDWLSKLQSEVDAAEEVEKHKDDFEVVPDLPASPTGTGPLPSWLTGIEQAMPSPTGTPAFVFDNKNNSPSEEGETAFPMETPDWLSSLDSDQSGEKAAEDKEGQPDSENLEPAELPSWVRAMRPVEAVVESKTTPLDESQVTEQSGPLAGLRGVLPAMPGLGLLRKSEAYSSKLQVSDGQHRHAKALEQLVSGETHPRAAGTTRLASNRILRWLITVLLFLAVGLPFASGTQFVPATLLLSSDKGASSKIIESLPVNVPVLVAFDYDPALFGELEAVAAPLMDQLLTKGTPLALISTSPTGPALAEHFLKTTSLVNVHKYQSGEQYVNLGYLAGGPAGMLYFADSLRKAMPVGVDGKSAWKTGPLQGMQSLSNFAAVIILTDNTDTGRNWIEQAGPRLGNTPMLMVISAQAEPIIRPYFDSGQLKGLVSGLSDAKIYEQNYNRPGLAHHYWNSFGVGMLIAELLIFTCAVLGVMDDRRALRKDSREEV